VKFLQSHDYAAAMRLLKICVGLLKHQLGKKHPELKFKTFKNIAHVWNLQGNAKNCVVNLIKALKHALKMDDIEQYDVHAHLQNKIPIVETYVNICNAYASQGLTQDGLEYINGACMMSQKLMDIAYLRIHSSECSNEERNTLNNLYHQLISLNVLSFKTKGKLLEKLKRFHDALTEYFSAK
jgi:hypothetical protein